MGGTAVPTTPARHRQKRPAAKLLSFLGAHGTQVVRQLGVGLVDHQRPILGIGRAVPGDDLKLADGMDMGRRVVNGW